MRLCGRRLMGIIEMGYKIWDNDSIRVRFGLMVVEEIEENGRYLSCFYGMKSVWGFIEICWENTLINNEYVFSV